MLNISEAFRFNEFAIYILGILKRLYSVAYKSIGTSLEFVIMPLRCHILDLEGAFKIFSFTPFLNTLMRGIQHILILTSQKKT